MTRKRSRRKTYESAGSLAEYRLRHYEVRELSRSELDEAHRKGYLSDRLYEVELNRRAKGGVAA